MELAERFRYIMKLNQLSASAFADEIGVQRSSISHILSGRNKPSLEFIQKVLKRFPKVDAAWLISGVTQPERSEFSPSISYGDHEDKPLRNQVQSLEKEVVASHDQSNPKGTEGVVRMEDEPTSERLNRAKIKKIVVFYDDHTFEEFNP